ncbi:hypothetical protein AURANDRAFT_62014 [Aureococcus anophagefferens]|uniref:Polysaccharide biosynthesis domain-containing protein n=1 Tax=Aureococcus anophagefferens TaxID=44056 RepID=F0Y222_AURAN|nr:hypothetical protein AURANDRAFT_62014 [Aureococcus anophagefferens]EGB10626.1 hypothetical protein AURANDRAFT_62014 [Aureococcus anophagefferens]|eukprot:XP_009034229.1 hypothetical protein AURANDRAFT_62014 [Aureococcus anophagefferens]
MADGITNDPEIERNGASAAAEYAEWHWKALRRAVEAGAPKDVVLTRDRAGDDLLYRTFRASISHEVRDVAGKLNSPLWRDLLTCMNGRVDDFSFMTLLRPRCDESYEAQRADLLVVPRAQFIMIEVARCREGCYDALDFVDGAEAAHLSGAAGDLRAAVEAGDDDRALEAVRVLEAAPAPTARALKKTSAGRALAKVARGGGPLAARAGGVVDAWKRALARARGSLAVDLSDVDGAFAIFEKQGVVTAEHVLPESLVAARAAKESEIPNFKGSYLGRFPLVAALRGAADESLARLEAEELAPQNLRVGDAYDLPCATHRPGDRVDVRYKAAAAVAARAPLPPDAAYVAADGADAELLPVASVLLDKVRPLLQRALRCDAPRVLYFGFVRAFGRKDDAPRSPQPWHRDAPSLYASTLEACDSAPCGAHVVNVFFPLTQLRPSNGPTAFAPATHLDAACAAALEDVVAGREPPRAVAPLLGPGDAALFDCRLLHRGGVNDSSEDRVIAYVTVAAPWWRDERMFHAAPAGVSALAALGRCFPIDDGDDGAGHPHYTRNFEALVAESPGSLDAALRFLASDGKARVAERLTAAFLDDAKAYAGGERSFKGAALVAKAADGALFTSMEDDLAKVADFGLPKTMDGVVLFLALAKRAASKQAPALEAAVSAWWHGGEGRFRLARGVLERPETAGDPALLVAFSSLGSGLARPEWMGTARKLELPGGANRLDVLHVLDPAFSWYLSADDGSWRGPAFYREKLEGFVAGYGAVLFLGDSMGGSGALAHCDLATATLAFTPQVDVAAYPAVARHDLTPARRAALPAAIAAALGRAKGPVEVARLPASVSAVAHDFDDHVLSIHLKARGKLLGIVNEALARA